MRKAVTVKLSWRPFGDAGASTPRSATPVSKADAQAIGSALIWLAEKRAAARRRPRS